MDFDGGSVALSGLIDGRARIIGLIVERHLSDVPHGSADFGNDVTVAGPSVLRHGRLARLRNAARERHRRVFHRHVRLVVQRRIFRWICRWPIIIVPLFHFIESLITAFLMSLLLCCNCSMIYYAITSFMIKKPQ